MFIQYGIYIDSDETGHLYLSYFDTSPLDPAFYSFGSRNANVEIFNAHIVQLNEEEQIKLRCAPTSAYSKATELSCDYKCHHACDGCYKPHSLNHCKKCLYATIQEKNKTENLLCALNCPKGFRPIGLNNVCTDIDECMENIHECQMKAECINIIGSYVCVCQKGFIGNGLYCEGCQMVF